MTHTQQPENKMGTMPIPKLLFTMSLPMILSMLVQALYNIVDSIFVARLSEKALTAVSLTFPVQNLMIAIAVGTGVGINALLSRYLGAHRYEDANQTAKNGIFLGLVSYLVFAIVGVLGSRVFFSMQTSDPVIIQYGSDYMFIITLFSIGIFMQITFERLLQSTGRTLYNMITQGTGAIINIILDPILIFGWFGFPRMEVTGAAIATVIGQIVALFMGLYYNCRKNPEININMRHFRPHKKTILKIYEIGIPSIIMESIGSITTFGMNHILLMFSSTATAVFGIYFKLQSFIFMPVFGLNNGMIPIIAYNYGAQNKKRITATIRLSILSAVSIMLIGFCLFQALPRQLLQLFHASSHMMSIAIPAFRIISLSFIFAGYCIILSSVFQALGNGVYSLIISVIRQLLVILPIAYVFAKLFGLSAVWWAVPIAEIAAVILSTLLMKRIYQQKLKHL
ncbi:MAG: MATE family efflux transporter [Lachnospiraceae bacterium]